MKMHSNGRTKGIMLNRRFIVLGLITLALLAAILWHIEEISRFSRDVWHPVDMRVGSSIANGNAPPRPKISTEVVEDGPLASISKIVLPSDHAPPAKAVSTPGAKAKSKGMTSWYKKAPQHVEDYFDSAFGIQDSDFHLKHLEHVCATTIWQEEGNVYLECRGLGAGVTSVMSELKVCFKLAIEAGTHLILPKIPIRSKSDIAELNMMNPEAHLNYEDWFDAPHLLAQMERHCPQMKLVHPSLINGAGPDGIKVKNAWNIDIKGAFGYQFLTGYFWTGRPWRSFFEKKYLEAQQAAFLDPAHDNSAEGATVLDVGAFFLLFRITDDPTHNDLHLWNDLSHLIRFKPDVRAVVREVASKIARPYYAVHFRAENDTIWSTPEHQLQVDLEALDQAWEKFGGGGAQKPMVYLACGDIEQVRMFQAAGAKRGWEVTHKWELLKDDQPALDDLMGLAFDFQGGVDYGIMLKGDFFLGIIGSAFSSTIGHNRDPTGRYRGSSFLVEDDGGARTHLFNDFDSTYYACCL